MDENDVNRMTIIAIENDILEGINYQDLIENFASKNVKRAVGFG